MPRKKTTSPSVHISADGHATLSAWFKSRGWTPYHFQQEAWSSFLAGRSGLIHVPTGAGKTFAAYGGPLAEMITDLASEPLNGLRVLYITPLRAVSRDIELALRTPVLELGLPIKVESRTGDTSSATRVRQRQRLPQVLVTTPESLSLMLTWENAAQIFAPLRSIILDEWHELLSTKRGTQTELALARLRTFAPRMRTWALSATLQNLAEAARAAVGMPSAGGGCAAPPAEPHIISARLDRPISIRTIIPSRPDAFPWAGHLGLSMLPDVIASLDPTRSTLLFTNTRSQAELWHQALLATRPEWAPITGLHHGSVDRAQRERVEAGLKDGSIRIVIATSSLDLGVDFAPVEEVYQIGSPKGIARLIQRAGRSGHRPGAPCRVTCVPTHGLELIEIDAVRRAIATGDIEPRIVSEKPLDVLAQHMVTAGLGGGFVPDDLFHEVRSAYSYRNLTRAEFDWTLTLVRDGGATLWAYPHYRKLADVDGRLRVTVSRIGQMHKLNIGTIVSEATMSVALTSGKRLGSIEEDFVSFLKPGDRFLFAGRTLEYVRTRELTAYVRPARGPTRFTPRWAGTRMPISESLASAVRLTLERAAAGDRDSKELAAAGHIVESQGRISLVPRADELLIETCLTAEGRHLFFYPFEGRLVHLGLAAILSLRLSRLRPATYSISANDYGFELLTAASNDFTDIITPALFSGDNIFEDALASVNIGELSRAQFREVARVAGLVFTAYPGVRKSARQIHASSTLLFEVFTEFDPANLLLEQARREVMDRQFERGRLSRAIDRLRGSTLRIVPVREPTPLGFPLIIERDGGTLSSQTILARVQAMKTQWETHDQPSTPPRSTRSTSRARPSRSAPRGLRSGRARRP